MTTAARQKEARAISFLFVLCYNSVIRVILRLLFSVARYERKLLSLPAKA